jgi:predicted transcriptional regulator
MGHTFYEGTAPRIAAALERIAKALEDQKPAIVAGVVETKPASSEPVGVDRDITEILARLVRLERTGTVRR